MKINISEMQADELNYLNAAERVVFIAERVEALEQKNEDRLDRFYGLLEELDSRIALLEAGKK